MIAAVKVEHVNPFVVATMETFKSMVKSEAKPGKPTLVKDNKTQFDISGIIGLSGGAQGTVSLSFPKIACLKIVSAFGAMKAVALDEDVVDAVGELANIIAGAAKKDLAQYNINISLPTVVMGDNHQLAAPRNVIPMAVPFECALGNFNLVVSFKSET
jgi:chemotaxis protein CheX